MIIRFKCIHSQIPGKGRPITPLAYPRGIVIEADLGQIPHESTLKSNHQVGGY